MPDGPSPLGSFGVSSCRNTRAQARVDENTTSNEWAVANLIRKAKPIKGFATLVHSPQEARRGGGNLEQLLGPQGHHHVGSSLSRGGNRREMRNIDEINDFILQSLQISPKQIEEKFKGIKGVQGGRLCQSQVECQEKQLQKITVYSDDANRADQESRRTKMTEADQVMYDEAMTGHKSASQGPTPSQAATSDQNLRAHNYSDASKTPLNERRTGRLMRGSPGKSSGKKASQKNLAQWKDSSQLRQQATSFQHSELKLRSQELTLLRDENEIINQNTKSEGSGNKDRALVTNKSKLSRDTNTPRSKLVEICMNEFQDKEIDSQARKLSLFQAVQAETLAQACVLDRASPGSRHSQGPAPRPNMQGPVVNVKYNQEMIVEVNTSRASRTNTQGKVRSDHSCSVSARASAPQNQPSLMATTQHNASKERDGPTMNTSRMLVENQALDPNYFAKREGLAVIQDAEFMIGIIGARSKNVSPAENGLAAGNCVRRRNTNAQLSGQDLKLIDFNQQIDDYEVLSDPEQRKQEQINIQLRKRKYTSVNRKGCFSQRNGAASDEINNSHDANTGSAVARIQRSESSGPRGSVDRPLDELCDFNLLANRDLTDALRGNHGARVVIEALNDLALRNLPPSREQKHIASSAAGAAGPGAEGGDGGHFSTHRRSQEKFTAGHEVQLTQNLLNISIQVDQHDKTADAFFNIDEGKAVDGRRASAKGSAAGSAKRSGVYENRDRTARVKEMAKINLKNLNSPSLKIEHIDNTASNRHKMLNRLNIQRRRNYNRGGLKVSSACQVGESKESIGPAQDPYIAKGGGQVDSGRAPGSPRSPELQQAPEHLDCRYPELVMQGRKIERPPGQTQQLSRNKSTQGSQSGKTDAMPQAHPVCQPQFEISIPTGADEKEGLSLRGVHGGLEGGNLRTFSGTTVVKEPVPSDPTKGGTGQATGEQEQDEESFEQARRSGPARTAEQPAVVGRYQSLHNSSGDETGTITPPRSKADLAEIAERSGAFLRIVSSPHPAQVGSVRINQQARAQKEFNDKQSDSTHRSHCVLNTMLQEYDDNNQQQASFDARKPPQARRQKNGQNRYAHTYKQAAELDEFACIQGQSIELTYPVNQKKTYETVNGSAKLANGKGQKQPANNRQLINCDKLLKGKQARMMRCKKMAMGQLEKKMYEVKKITHSIFPYGERQQQYEQQMIPIVEGKSISVYDFGGFGSQASSKQRAASRETEIGVGTSMSQRQAGGDPVAVRTGNSGLSNRNAAQQVAQLGFEQRAQRKMAEYVMTQSRETGITGLEGVKMELNSFDSKIRQQSVEGRRQASKGSREGTQLSSRRDDGRRTRHKLRLEMTNRSYHGETDAGAQSSVRGKEAEEFNESPFRIRKQRPKASSPPAAGTTQSRPLESDASCRSVKTKRRRPDQVVSTFDQQLHGKVRVIQTGLNTPQAAQQQPRGQKRGSNPSSAVRSRSISPNSPTPEQNMRAFADNPCAQLPCINEIVGRRQLAAQQNADVLAVSGLAPTQYYEQQQWVDVMNPRVPRYARDTSRRTPANIKENLNYVKFEQDANTSFCKQPDQPGNLEGLVGQAMTLSRKPPQKRSESPDRDDDNCQERIVTVNADEPEEADEAQDREAYQALNGSSRLEDQEQDADRMKPTVLPEEENQQDELQKLDLLLAADAEGYVPSLAVSREVSYGAVTLGAHSPIRNNKGIKLSSENSRDLQQTVVHEERAISFGDKEEVHQFGVSPINTNKLGPSGSGAMPFALKLRQLNE